MEHHRTTNVQFVHTDMSFSELNEYLKASGRK